MKIFILSTLTKKIGIRYCDFMAGVYKSIFNMLGIGDKTYYTLASGGTFSNIPMNFKPLRKRAKTQYIFAVNAKWP